MRRVITEKDAGLIKDKGGYVRAVAPSNDEAEKDSYRDKLLKYIPAEIIALYVMGDEAIRAYPELTSSWLWGWFVICVIATPIYINWISKDPKLPKELSRPNRQIVIATIAFIVWVISLGGPFSTLDIYHPIVGILLLPLYTFFVPMF